MGVGVSLLLLYLLISVVVTIDTLYGFIALIIVQTKDIFTE